ncbi:MAG TPA: twin-arginine translocation signal domain-containing protein [Terracidiphilus sp.]|nr:twin-arginine translocation signal domain-containing protein [Terracidiphilus sp.]
MSGDDRRDFLKKLATTVGAVSCIGNKALAQSALPTLDQSAAQAEVLATCAQPQSRAERGAPLVEVSHTDGKWVIAGGRQQAVLRESNLALAVNAQGMVWHMVPSARGDMILQRDGRETAVRLADAKRIEIHPFDTGFKTGVRLTLSHWGKFERLISEEILCWRGYRPECIVP